MKVFNFIVHYEKPTKGDLFFDMGKVTCRMGWEYSQNDIKLTPIWGTAENIGKDLMRQIHSNLLEANVSGDFSFFPKLVITI